MFAPSHWFRSLGVAAAIALGIGAAGAQEFPTKPITFIVANAPGDTADLSARVMAAEMSKILGQPVVVENRAGAGGLIGTEAVARAPADGYTIGALSVNATIILPLTVKTLRFDPIKDIPAFFDIGASKLVMATPSKQPWKTFDEMLTTAKANPGKFNYGSSSSTTRLMTELILRARGADVVYVPFSNTAANMLAMTQGETQMGITSEGQALGAGDAFRILAQTGDTRSERLPTVPLFSEVGFPQVRGAAYSFYARAETPKPIIDKLFAAASQALKVQSVRAALEKLPMDVATPTTPDAPAAVQRQLFEGFAAVAKQIGLQPE